MKQTVKVECPKCNYSFNLAEAITSDIEKSVRKEMEPSFQAKEAALEIKLRKNISDQMMLELKDLKEQIREKDKLVEESTKNELELRKKTRELEIKEKHLELDMERKLDAQRILIEEDLRKRVNEEYKLKSNEKDVQLESMKKTIEELKRKSEQGSQQAQGEALELEVEKILIAQFPMDTIESIAKGVKGADIFHIIRTPAGQIAGKILYETKNTKAWTDSWLHKAKEDQQNKNAEFVIIVSGCLPKEIRQFGLMNGVLVSDFTSFSALVQVVRTHLIEVHFVRNTIAGKDEKLDYLYRYITETQFRQRVEAIIEGFKAMRESLETEKRSMQRIWASREKSLERVIINAAGMYGDIQGIIGAALPKIEMLELENIPLIEGPSAS